MISKKTILACLAIALSGILLAQSASLKISGWVRSEDGEPLESVFISDGSLLFVTGEGGRFDVQTKADSLRFSRLGYESLSFHRDAVPPVVILPSKELNLPVIRVRESYESSALPAVNRSLIHSDTNSGSSSAADLLLKHSAFGSSDAALMGEYQSISILGGLSRHTLVMLDGMPMNIPGEAFDLSRIPASQISHIEIIKGASSVYGGSSAIGGIVNIVTHNPQTHLGMEAEAGVGSFGLHSQRLMAFLARDRLSLSAEYSRYDAQNDFEYRSSISPAEDLRRENNRKTAEHLFMKSAYAFPKGHLQALLSYDGYERELPGPTSFPMLYDAAEQTGSDALGRFSALYQHGRFSWESILALDYKEKTYKNLDSGSPFARAHEAQSYISPLFLQRLTVKHGGASIGLAGELKPIQYRYQNLLGEYGKGYDKYQNSALSASAQHQSGRGIWQQRSSLALRQDWADAERHTSWRIEELITLYLPIEVGLKMNLGTAFSLPSLFDLHYIGDSQTQANLSLKSENSFGYDFGVKLSQSAWHLEAARYHSKVENLIQWRQYFLNGSTWRPFNVGEAELTNWEFGAQIFPLDALSISGDLLLSDAKDRSLIDDGSPSATYGKYLPYSPKYRCSISVAYEPQSFGARLSYSRIGEQYSTVDNLAGSMPEIDSINLSGYAHKSFGDLSATLTLQLNNLQDNRYEIYAHIPQPGFNYKIALRLRYEWDL